MPNDNDYIRPGKRSVVSKKKSKEKTVKVTQGFANNDNNQVNINMSELERASVKIAERSNLNNEIMILVPELKQAQDIIVNSVISPNDFSKKELLAEFENSMNLPDDVVGPAKNIIETAIKKYKLTEELSDVVTTALFIEGAYPELIMPRSKISEIITRNEDMKLKNVRDLEHIDLRSVDTGLDNVGKVMIDLESKHTINGVEASLSNFGVLTSGNPNVLLLPEIYDNKRKDILGKELILSKKHMTDLESIDQDVLDMYDLFKERSRDIFKENQIILSSDSELTSDDVPFRLRLSSSSVIPIYTDDRRDHIGYFVLTDEINRPLNHEVSSTDLVSLYNSNKGTDNIVAITGLVESMNKKMDKHNDNSVLISNMLDIAGQVLMSSINKAMDDSLYRNNYNVDYENNLIKIILSRAFIGKETKLIFVPVEYMSYIAFDYRKNGTGKTLTEDITLLASFKAMLMVSGIYAAVNANIPVTDVIVEIDDEDPEPFKTKEMLNQLILTGDSRMRPWGETSIESFGTWIQNAGLRTTWINKAFPDTKITMDVKNKEMGYTPNTDMMDTISSYILRSLGLSPSILEAANQPEFASVAMLENAISNKINNERQDILNNGMSDKTRKLIKADTALFTSTLELVEKQKSKLLKVINAKLEKERKIKDLSEGLKVQLTLDLIKCMGVRVPRAESRDRDDLREKFDKFKDSVNNIIDIVKESSFFADAKDELGLSDENLTGNLKLMALVDWCEEHNYATGLVRLLGMTDKKELDNFTDRLKEKDSNLVAMVKAIAEYKKTLMEELAPKEESDDGTGDEYSDGETDTGEETDTGDDEFGDTAGDTDDTGDDEFGEESDESEDDIEEGSESEESTDEGDDEVGIEPEEDPDADTTEDEDKL